MLWDARFIVPLKWGYIGIMEKSGNYEDSGLYKV